MKEKSVHNYNTRSVIMAIWGDRRRKPSRDEKGMKEKGKCKKVDQF